MYEVRKTFDFKWIRDLKKSLYVYIHILYINNNDEYIFCCNKTIKDVHRSKE